MLIMIKHFFRQVESSYSVQVIVLFIFTLKCVCGYFGVFQGIHICLFS